MVAALGEAEATTVALAEAGALVTMTWPGARVTAPGETEEVALVEGEWVEWVWVTWGGWEEWVWVWVEEGEGQAHGAVEEVEEVEEEVAP